MSEVVSALYSVLAFAEVLVLFAAAIAVLVFVVRVIVREVNRLLDKAVTVATPDPDSSIKTREPVSVGAGSRLHKIRGGHNEHF